MIIPTGADDQRMTTAKRQTLARLHVLLALRGPGQGRPVRLLAAAAQPGAGRLRAARQAEGGRPGGRPRPNRDVDQVQQPDLRRRATSSENKLAADRAAAGRVRQGGRGPVRHRRPAPASRRPTSADAPTTERPAARTATATGGGAGTAARRRPERSGGDRSTRSPARRSTRAPAPAVERHDGTDARRAEPIYADADRARRPTGRSDSRAFGWLAVARAARAGPACPASCSPRARRRDGAAPMRRASGSRAAAGARRRPRARRRRRRRQPARGRARRGGRRRRRTRRPST